MEALMIQTQSILNDEAKQKILQIIKTKSTKAIFLGSKDPADKECEKLLCASDTKLEDLTPYIITTTDVRGAYFDADGNLSFEILLDYESSFEQYIYALALVGEDSIYAISLTPKIKKITGVGGSFLLKTNIEGKSASMVFKNDNFISDAELEVFKAFLSKVDTRLDGVVDSIELALQPLKNFETQIHNIETQIEAHKNYQIMYELNAYVDKEIEFYKKKTEHRDRIGRKDYFYRNTLPSTHRAMGDILDASEYPVLYYLSKNTAYDNGSFTIKLPPSSLYSKGTQIQSEIGSIKQSALPNITGNINVDRAHSLYGDGVFEQQAPKDHFDIGNKYWNGNYSRLHFDASRSSPIYGRADEVEVTRVHYLEGIYTGRGLSDEKKKSIALRAKQDFDNYKESEYPYGLKTLIKLAQRTTNQALKDDIDQKIQTDKKVWEDVVKTQKSAKQEEIKQAQSFLNLINEFLKEANYTIRSNNE